MPSLDVLTDELQESVAMASSEPGALVSPRLLELYMAQGFEDEPEAALLWDSYRMVFSRAGAYESDTAQAHLKQHLALAELLYRDAPPAEAGLTARAEHATQWWMEQLKRPADEGHERLIEHLRRISEARADYSAASSATGLDARGETLVRYGAPSRTRKVSFNDAELLRSFFKEGLPVRLSDFPDNEVWLYDQLGEEALFLFVEGPRGEGYSHGSVNDLLPRQLRNRGVSGSARGFGFALASLRTMRFIFSQLALFHPTYGSRYDSIADYVNWQEERRISDRLGGRSSGAVANYSAATRTLETALEQNQREDSRIAERRSAALPDQYVQAPRVPVPELNALAVRFLEDGGSTRLHVYWQPDAYEHPGYNDELAELPVRQRARLVGFSADYGLRDILADTTFTMASGLESMGRVEVALEAPLLHTALQVDQAVVDSEERAASNVLPLGSSVFQAGPLTPLAATGQTLEVSDLLPFRVEDVVEQRAQLQEGFERHHLSPYPGATLAGLPALGIYFEVYDKAEHQSDYLITYQIVKRRRGGFLQRRRVEDANFQSRRATKDQRLPAVFLVDRAEWADADEIEVVVTVFDTGTGDEVSRTLRFRTAP